jgi:serine/threonine-protein kinase RsbW
MFGEKENKKIYRLNADYSNLSELRDFVAAEAVKHGFSNDDAYLISLAVDEACTNLIRYAYKFDKTKKIEIIISADSNKFIAKIKDSGAPFNPLDVPPPDMEEYFKEFKRGGLGIYIIRNAMDEISYIPANSTDSYNELTLVKYLSKNGKS